MKFGLTKQIMKPTPLIYSMNYLAAFFVLLAATAPAAIVNVGLWHLGEPGTVGNSSPYTLELPYSLGGPSLGQYQMKS